MTGATAEFDIEVWKNTGKAQVDLIDHRIKDIKKEMATYQNEIDELTEGKIEILKVLGKWEEPSTTKSKIRAKRVVVRPLLMEKLIMNENRAIPTLDLIDYVRNGKPAAKVSTIKASIARLVKLNSHVAMDGDAVTYSAADLR